MFIKTLMLHGEKASVRGVMQELIDSIGNTCLWKWKTVRSFLTVRRLQDYLGHIWTEASALLSLMGDSKWQLPPTFLISRMRGHMWVFGVLLDMEVHVVQLHIQADGSSWVAVHGRLEAADWGTLARAGRIFWISVRRRKIQGGEGGCK